MTKVNVRPSIITTESAMPKAAAVAVGDLLDHAARIKPGQRVLILAYLDGLYGGDNLVDRDAIHWVQQGVEERGAKARVLWANQPAAPYQWQFPSEVREAMDNCDVLINHSFDLVVEEILAFRQYIDDRKLPMVRNFATTGPLLCTTWAQTPHELVSEIRYQAAVPIKPGLPWKLTDDRGTHLEGVVLPVRVFSQNLPVSNYAARREDGGYYFPWPEWVVPPITLGNTSGTCVFDCMLSWWSRYIGISPYFSQSVRLTIDNNRITKIEGGSEAEALRRFLEAMRSRIGEGAYDFDTMHFGVHPQASVAPHQCPNVLYRRLIEHSHCCNIHVHIGAHATPPYPYWMHCTGDLRTATFRVGDTLIHDRGRLAALDDPAVLAVAAEYPDRPGLRPAPRCF